MTFFGSATTSTERERAASKTNNVTLLACLFRPPARSAVRLLNVSAGERDIRPIASDTTSQEIGVKVPIHTKVTSSMFNVDLT
jgi:hypothetical protein